MSDIQSWHLRMGGEPTFKNRRLTISTLIGHLAAGTSIKEFCEGYKIDEESVKAALIYISDNIKKWMRPIRRWELWESDSESSHTFAPSESITSLFASGAMPADSKRTWTIDSDSTIDAMTEYHKHLGLEPYKPMVDENGNMYAEDGGDTL